MKKLGFGIVWFLALSMGAIIVGGAIVGGMAGAENPENAQAAGEAAGQAFGEAYSGMIFLSAFIIAVLGSIFGLLPGTKSEKLN